MRMSPKTSAQPVPKPVRWVASSKDDLSAFPLGNRLQRMPRLVSRSRSHLDEHQGPAILDDDVELALTPAPVAHDDAHPEAF